MPKGKVLLQEKLLELPRDIIWSQELYTTIRGASPAFRESFGSVRRSTVRVCALYPFGRQVGGIRLGMAKGSSSGANKRVLVLIV